MQNVINYRNALTSCDWNHIFDHDREHIYKSQGNQILVAHLARARWYGKTNKIKWKYNKFTQNNGLPLSSNQTFPRAESLEQLCTNRQEW